MRIAYLRNFSLSLGLVSLLTAGAASAQSLVGVNARLDHTFSSKTATVGEAVSLKLDGTVHTTSGVKLPKGTELMGKVVDVKNASGSGPVSVSFVFTTAQLKGGKQIPVKATLVHAYPADALEQATYGGSTMDLPPTQVSSDEVFNQAAGALPKVALTSAVKSDNSGTLSSAEGNFELATGTYLQVALAPEGSSAGQ